MRIDQTVLVVSGLLLCTSLSAQHKSPRFLPVDVSVMVDGAADEQFTVTLFKDNEQVTQLLPSKHSAFELALDLDAVYTIRISKEGYREKLVLVDTHLPEGVEKYDAYPCVVVLEPADRFAKVNPFYLDFPCAMVRWDASKQSFDHSDQYLVDIQEKVAEQSSTDPE